MSHLPAIRIADLEVSRLIVGGNPFSGFSHASGELDREMLDYYTTARIKQTLAEAEAAGIDTFLGRADAHIRRVLHEYWNEGGRIQWIAQTAPEMSDLLGNIRAAKGAGAAGCYIHGGTTQQRYDAGRLGELQEALCLIRDLDMAAGIATHDPRIPLQAEELGLATDFYMMCFHNIQSGSTRGFVQEDRVEAARTVRAVPKPCLAFKILGAGRWEPKEAFTWAYANIKPTDAVVVGVFTKRQPAQVADDVELACEAIRAAGQ